MLKNHKLLSLKLLVSFWRGGGREDRFDFAQNVAMKYLESGLKCFRRLKAVHSRQISICLKTKQSRKQEYVQRQLCMSQSFLNFMFLLPFSVL